METYVVIIIIIVILSILVGIGVGLYFFFRKKIQNHRICIPDGNTCPGLIYPKLAVPLNPPDNVAGVFKISPVSNSDLVLSADGTEGSPQLRKSDYYNNKCSYSWRNKSMTWTDPSGIISSSPIFLPNALVFGNGTNWARSSPIIIESWTFYTKQPLSLGWPNNNCSVQNWQYDKETQTWCGIGNQCNVCLYATPDNTVTIKTYDSSDNNFRWTNIPMNDSDCPTL